METGFDNKKIGISLLIVDEKEITELNRKFRNKNKETDVLSFPLTENIHSGTGANKNKNDILELGDIFICLPVAKKNAIKDLVSLEKELVLLAVHGFLHLIGYDHQTLKDEEKMFPLQKKIVSKIYAH
jgi:probable rRNA maturation factor